MIPHCRRCGWWCKRSGNAVLGIPQARVDSLRRACAREHLRVFMRGQAPPPPPEERLVVGYAGRSPSDRPMDRAVRQGAEMHRDALQSAATALGATRHRRALDPAGPACACFRTPTVAIKILPSSPSATANPGDLATDRGQRWSLASCQVAGCAMRSQAAVSRGMRRARAFSHRQAARHWRCAIPPRRARWRWCCWCVGGAIRPVRRAGRDAFRARQALTRAGWPPPAAPARTRCCSRRGRGGGAWNCLAERAIRSRWAGSLSCRRRGRRDRGDPGLGIGDTNQDLRPNPVTEHLSLSLSLSSVPLVSLMRRRVRGRGCARGDAAAQAAGRFRVVAT